MLSCLQLHKRLQHSSAQGSLFFVSNMLSHDLNTSEMLYNMLSTRKQAAALLLLL